MQVGDYVRFLHGSEKGKISKIIDNKTIEVEIEDGFGIPVLMSEVVLVNQAGEKHFEDRRGVTKPSMKKEETDDWTPAAPTRTEKLWLGAMPQDEDRYTLYLLNDSSFELLFTWNIVKVTGHTTEAQGQVAAGEKFMLEKLRLSEIEKWPQWELHLLYAKSNFHTPKHPEAIPIKLKGKKFYQEMVNLPVLNQKGILFSLEPTHEKEVSKANSGSSEAPKPDAEKIKESLMGEPERIDYRKDVARPKVISKIVDLHIENLSKDFQQLNAGEIVQLQLETFEKELDKGLHLNMEDITFIHGVGNGKLKDEIRQRLASHPHVAEYKDAKKEKYGYGATWVRFK